MATREPAGPPPAPRSAGGRRWLIVGVLVILGALLVPVVIGLTGDRRGGGDDEPSDQSATADEAAGMGSTSAPEPGMASLGPGEIAVYFTASTGATSDYVAEYGITLETSGGAVFRYLPAADELSVVDTYASASFAKLTLFPLTVDGRLFLIRHGRETHDSDLYELDVGDHRRLDPPGRLLLTDSPDDPTAYSVSGDRLTWVSPHDFDVLSGNTGGEVYARTFGGERREVLDDDAPGNLGEIHTGGGRVYRVHFDPETQLVVLAGADPSTTAATDVIHVLDVAPVDVDSWQFAVDQDAFWLAGTIYGQGTGQPTAVGLFRVGLDANDAVDRVFETVLADERDWVIALDADQGCVVMALAGWGDESFIVYDHATGIGTKYALGLAPTYSQILVGR